MKSNIKGRFKGLDSLRGIAAFSVMICHYTHVYNVFYPYNYKDYFGFEIGGRAVELFFILSGFVIFFSIQGIQSSRQFLLQRFIRLFPTYWVCLTLTFTTVYFFGLPGLEVSWKEALIGFTMVPQLFGVQKVDYSYWTLVPELFFYLVISLVIITKTKNRILEIGAFWLILSFIHIYIFHIKGLGLVLLLDYFPFFFSGILFFELKANKSNRIVWVLLFLSYLIGLGRYIHKPDEMILMTLIYVTYLIFVLKNLSFLENRVLIFIGKISYALYLIHQFVGYVILNHVRMYFDSMIVIIVPIIVSIILATIITFYIEQPTIRYLKNYRKKI
tara:strand:- start:212 stop:1201 length:990 start_codon:yes stop_codon:yes gene_type:complete